LLIQFDLTANGKELYTTGHRPGGMLRSFSLCEL